MKKSKKFLIALLTIGILLPTSFANGMDWGLSIAPKTAWRSSWDNCDTRTINSEKDNGSFHVDKIEDYNSYYLVSRVINALGNVRTGRVTVKEGCTGKYPSPGLLNSPMSRGYEYTPDIYNTTSTTGYVWAFGEWNADY